MAQWLPFAAWSALAVVAFAVGATAKAAGNPHRRAITVAAWVCFFLTLIFAPAARAGDINLAAGIAIVAVVYCVLFVWALAGGKAKTPRMPKGYTGSTSLSMDERRGVK